MKKSEPHYPKKLKENILASASATPSSNASQKTNNCNGNGNGLCFDYKNLSKWSVETTVKWLKFINYEDCGDYFIKHKINGRALLMLNEDDLKEVIKHNVGQRKNLYHLIRVLQIRYNRFMNNAQSRFFSSTDDDEDDENDDGNRNENEDINSDEASDFKSSVASNEDLNKSSSPKSDLNDSKSLSEHQTSYESHNSYKSSTKGKNTLIHRHLINETYKELNSQEQLDEERLQLKNKKSKMKKVLSRSFNGNDHEDDDCIPNFCENCLKKFDHSPYTNYAMNSLNFPLRSYKGEKRKTFVSVVYLFLTCLWTSFMLTVVHDRVPDMQRYPPLPDIILDNIPLIPWAFFATEIIGIVLLLIFLFILMFHKYRLIIFRRMCSLGGTIFFLRSITMLITSLSVPGIHIQCSSQRYGSLMNKLKGAWTILSGVGLYVQGVRTCGDYMFSGHTVWLTLLTHFINEYTPHSMNWLHTIVWVMNFFGLFFILGAHEHYSIDVFIAFYITSRLFLYYHSLANNKVLFQRDHKRVKIWFPMLSYFESNIHSIVPNEYQYPPNLFKLFKYKVIKKLLPSKKN